MSLRRALGEGLSAWVERAILAALLLLSSDAAPPIPTATDTAAQVVELLEAGEWQTLHEDRLSSTTWRYKSRGDLRRATSFIAEYGQIHEIVPIEVTQLHGTFRVRAERGEWDLEIAITQTGTITQFTVSKIEPIPPVMRSAPLALPVQGTWQVRSLGLRTAPEPRADERSVRRSLDLAIVDSTGQSHRGEGLENHDYHAYGQPIHAMDAGQVVMVVDGVPDHEPGVRGAYRLGNTIVIRHAGNLHSVYAHLRPGRARVRSGDAVERGQVLGESGNSGFSTLPHVHVHLQDDFIIGKAWGVEAVFADPVVEREGVQRLMTNVSLLEGDVVSHDLKP